MNVVAQPKNFKKRKNICWYVASLESDMWTASWLVLLALSQLWKKSVPNIE